MKPSWFKERIETKFILDPVFPLLAQSEKFSEPRRVPPSVIDSFLYCGRFNSVLGLDGFGTFKDGLKDVLRKVNDDDFGANYINLDKMFEALLASGVYYLEEHLSEELAFLKGDPRWLTAYRYIAKNFPTISYSDFREIVKRFQETSGYSFYVQKDDSDSLLKIAQHDEFFLEVVDAKSVLLQLSQSQLRDICKAVGAKPSRTSEETASRIMAAAGEGVHAHIPDDFKTRRSFLVKDFELATGEDIIHLDSYLRSIAKVVRQDLVEFIDRRRHWNLIPGGGSK